MFDTKEEAYQKLYSTIVLYDEDPVLIQGVNGSEDAPVLTYYRLDDKDQELRERPITDKAFNFRNLGGRLGYVNSDYKDYHQALWSRRTPIRKSHSTQGLSSHNIRIEDFSPDPVLGLRRTQIPFSHLKSMDGFHKTLKKKFPALNTVASSLSKEREIYSMAFDRCLAIRRSQLGLFYLLYKGQEIGYTEDFFHFKVPKQFRHLDELLIEEHNLKVM